MSFKRYVFKSGLDIIAPLKCGTRWLDGLDVENRIDASTFNIIQMEENVHSGTTFIWRPVREHFISAIKTEFYLSHDIQIEDILTKMEFFSAGHWTIELYKKLYPLWLKYEFKFHKLRALSELASSASKHKWTSSLFDFNLPIEHITIEEALKSLSPEHLIKIEKWIDEEEKWLKLMIESQYSQKIGEDYSNLEDSMLETKGTVMDLEESILEMQSKIKNLENETLKMKDHNRKIKHYNVELQGEVMTLKNDIVSLESRMAKFKKPLI
jgi:hypothetical protein